MEIETDGATIHFDSVGEGVPLLLIAGTAASGSTWPLRMIELLAETFQVITYDNRGTGSTTDTSREYSTRQFASDAAAVLEALTDQAAHVLGHSMGGRVAQWFALDRPDLTRSLVLAASGPGSFPGQFAQGKEMPRGIPLELAVSIANEGYDSFLRARVRDTFFTPSCIESRPDLVRAVEDVFLSTGPDVEGYFKHVIARQAHQTVDRLGEIQMPTLVLYGDSDTYHGFAGSHVDQSRYLAEAISGAESIVLPGLAHGYFWEDTDRSVGILIDWLLRH